MKHDDSMACQLVTGARHRSDDYGLDLFQLISMTREVPVAHERDMCFVKHALLVAYCICQSCGINTLTRTALGRHCACA